MTSSNQPIYQVGIIGAGRIAAGFDSPQDLNFLTHAHAFTSHPRIRCLGFHDTDSQASTLAAKKWDLRNYPSLDELLCEKLDIIVVAVPDEAHFDVVDQALSAAPRLILCEKPLTPSLARSVELARKCRERGVGLAVNYQRRYDSIVIRLKEDLAAGRLGRPVSGAVWYSKGILHNGSHAVDTLRYILGEAKGFAVHRKTWDFTPTDPTVAGTLFFDGIEIAFQAGNEKLFSLFEIDLIFEKARFRFTQSGTNVERYEVRDDPTYAGYRELLSMGTAPTGLLQALPLMVADLVRCLDQGLTPRIATDSVLGSQRICEAMAQATETPPHPLKGSDL